MNNTQSQFKNLPPPPKGQQGVTLDQFKHLPPPPKDQTGMTLDQIQGQQSQPNKFIQTAKSLSPILGEIASKGAQIAGQEIQGVGNTFKQGANEVTSAINNVPQNAQVAGGSPGAYALSGLGAAGHVAGAIAGTAGGLVGDAISPYIPDAIKNKIGDVAGHINSAVDKIPGMTPEIHKGISDVINTLTLEGGAKAEVPVKAGIKTGIEKIGNMIDKSEANKIATQAEKSNQNAFKSITPVTTELTPTEYQDLLLKNKITPKTATQPAQYILSDAEKQNAIKNKDLLQSKDPVKNSINVMNKISTTDKEVGDFLRKNNGIYNNGELKNYISNKLKDVTDVTVDEGRVSKLKENLVNGFIKALPKNDMENLWQARKNFDKSIEKVFNGSPSLQNTVKKEFRNAVQDFIAERTPEGVYKGKMKDMRNLFDLHETIATKAAKGKTLNGIQQWMKDHPTQVKIIGYGIPTVVGGAEAIHLLAR